MKKALYLALVFMMPVISALIPIDHFQDIWIWLYLPFGLVYSIFIWKKPNDSMMVWVTLTPVFFLMLVLIVIPGWVGVESGAIHALQFFLVVAIVAIPAAIISGPIYVLLAYAIFVLFRKYDLLPASS
jgi:hypothetical protein